MMKLVLVFFIMLFTGCSKSEKLKNHDLLKVAASVEAKSLYPYQANDPHSSRIYSQIFETLILHDESNNLVPGLATEWKFLNDLTLEIKIRQNVLFHNNQIMTIDDVKFSFDQILASPNLAHTVKSIKDTKIIDQSTLHLILKEPDVTVLFLLASPTMVIVNKKAVLEAGDDVSSKPIGTGPYQLSEWIRGQSIVLKVFEQYWNEIAKIPTIEIRTISDVAARAIALEANDVDLAFDIEGTDIERIAGNPDLILYDVEIPRVEYIAMNIGKGSNPLWKSAKGRQAFEWLIDKEGLTEYVLFGAGKAANTLVPPMIDGHDDTIVIRQKNSQKAKELLAELMITNPNVNILVREGTSQKIAEVLQSQLLEANIQSSITIAEYGRFLEMIAQGQHDVFVLNWTVVTGDPDYALNNLLNSNSWGSKGNRSFYSSPVIDDLLQKAKIEKNPQQRIEYYKKIQQIAYEEVPYIPLYYPTLNIGASAHLQNVFINMFGYISFNKLLF
ncbi:MAG: ABC transporter substrate-binding protein [Brevinema sp.]